MYDGRSIKFSSTTLTDTQSRYAQIDKELIAIQFGAKKFRSHVFGQETTLVHTDQKSLIGILAKPISDCSPRIQRMRIQLNAIWTAQSQHYTFREKIWSLLTH